MADLRELPRLTDLVLSELKRQRITKEEAFIILKKLKSSPPEALSWMADAWSLEELRKNLLAPSAAATTATGVPRDHPLSPAQKRIYLLCRFSEVGLSYNLYVARLLPGAPDSSALERSVNALIERHEILRTSFHFDDGDPRQVVHPAAAFRLPPTARHSTLDEALEAFVKPFDLERPELFRAALAQLADGRFFLLLDMHHLVSDGISMGVVLPAELFALYRGQNLPPPRLQYKEHCRARISFAATEAYRLQKDYWQTVFSEPAPVLDLLPDFPRPSVKSFAGGSVLIHCPSELRDALEGLRQQTQSTMFMVLFAVYGLFLHKYTGQEDLVVGTPVSGRRGEETEKAIGLFINVLLLRVRPRPGIGFRAFLGEVKSTILEAFRHQDFSYEDILEQAGPRRDLSRNPLFDTMFSYQSSIPLEAVESAQNRRFHSKLDLSVEAFESGSGIDLLFEYCSALFRPDTVERMGEHFKELMRRVAADPEAGLETISLTTAADRRILEGFNRTREAFPRDRTIVELFEEQVERSPGRTALVGCGAEVSYGELNRSANAVARRLRELGAGREAVVGIEVPRSAALMAGIFGILKSGAAYLPIDPRLPEDRKRFMLSDSGARWLVCPEGQGGWAPGDCAFVDPEPSGTGAEPNLPRVNRAEDLAYVIYTSGTTGRPKGVMIEHRSVVNRLHWMQRKYPLGSDDVLMQKTPVSFDVSVWELFWWSWHGARLCLLEPGAERDPQEILRCVREHRVTAIHFVPSMLNAFLGCLESGADVAWEGLSSLKRVFASGEALAPGQVKLFNRLVRKTTGAVLVNLYGPTEATVDVAFFDCPDGQEIDLVPIGGPIDNTDLLIVDRQGNVLPVGVPGELGIGGINLARGYLNRPELTAEKFTSHPLEPGRRIYRTGDRARWRADGTIEYLGRLDHQVKIRGYRIELGEVEESLRAVCGTEEAVAGVFVDANGDSHLCGYYALGQEIAPEDWRRRLSPRLPEYMIPAAFLRLDAIPLNANGKADRAKLPPPSWNLEARAVREEPRGEIEERLLGLMEEVLGRSGLGVGDPFFESGGTSLKAIDFINRVNRDFRANIPLKDFLSRLTVKSLAPIVVRGMDDFYLRIEKERQSRLERFFSFENRLLIQGIVPIHDDRLFCQEDIIATFCRWKGLSFELAFLHQWTFDFRPGADLEPRGGLLFQTPYDEPAQIQALGRYHGVRVTVHSGLSVDALVSLVRGRLSENLPVVLHYDIHHCPWFQNEYRRVHRGHYIPVIGIDEENSFFCVDPSPFSPGDILDFGHYALGFQGSCLTVDFTEPEPGAIDTSAIVREILEPRNRWGGSRPIRDWAQAIESRLDLAAEIAGHEENTFHAPLFERLQQAARSRRKLGMALRHLESRSVHGAILGEFAARFERIGLRWDGVRGLLIKASLSSARDGMIGAAAVKVRRIAEDEDRLACDLEELLRPSGLERTPSGAWEHSDLAIMVDPGFQAPGISRKAVMPDLAPHCNNQGLGSLDPRGTAELSAGHRGSGGFLVRDALLSGGTLKTVGTVFRLPPSQAEKDNVLCQGQIIPVEPGRYRLLDLLGCADFGSHAEELQLLFEGGLRKTVPLELTDWSLGAPFFGESVAWEGACARRIEGAVRPFGFTAKLYAVTIAWEPAGVLTALELPFCPNLHIFALTLR